MLLEDENLYYVGGIVRDEILGRNSIDIDLCYEGDAVEFAKDKHLNIIKTNEKLRTVRVIIEDKEIDIASTRREVYPRKGHLPEIVEIGCPLEEDLKRRDFTINSIAKRTTDGNIFDTMGGICDIKNKKIRVLHSESFIDDPTRIIRGLKFSSRLGFDLDNKTKELQDKYLDEINYDMSYHRLKNELVDTFSANICGTFYKFINDGMYRLLGPNNIQKPDFVIDTVNEIEKYIQTRSTPNSWLMYLSFFNLSKLDLTRQEKRILLWAEKLGTEKNGNNTPLESVFIQELRKKYVKEI